MADKKEKKEFQVDEWNALNSSTIESVRFNVGDTLDVRFKGAKEGKFYRYDGVNHKTWDDFMNAKSPGKFCGSVIQPKYGCSLHHADGSLIKLVKVVARQEKAEVDEKARA